MPLKNGMTIWSAARKQFIDCPRNYTSSGFLSTLSSVITTPIIEIIITDAELREDDSFELREDGSFELRDG